MIFFIVRWLLSVRWLLFILLLSIRAFEQLDITRDITKINFSIVIVIWLLFILLLSIITFEQRDIIEIIFFIVIWLLYILLMSLSALGKRIDSFHYLLFSFLLVYLHYLYIYVKSRR